MIFDTYSQWGEDVIIYNILKNTGWNFSNEKGTYVDIGANDGVKYSNTNILYKVGWRGINIEPTKNVYDRLIKNRPDDTNLNIAIYDGSNVDFYTYEMDELNTIKEITEIDKEINKKNGIEYNHKETYKVNTMKINDLFKKYNISKLELLSIDTEGLDEYIIKDIDFNKFNIKLILMESSREKINSNIEYLYTKGYELLSITINNLIFIKL